MMNCPICNKNTLKIDEAYHEGKIPRELKKTAVYCTNRSCRESGLYSELVAIAQEKNYIRTRYAD